MTLPRTITMTREGGHFYKAMAFNFAVTIPMLVPVIVALLLAIVNPFWFRDGFFRYIETKVNQLARWRNYKMYTIYLGTDPELWHTLAD